MRENKFDQRGKKVIFVGYFEVFNTFRFYDETNDKIIIKSDVVFGEYKTEETPIYKSPNEIICSVNDDNSNEQNINRDRSDTMDSYQTVADDHEEDKQIN